MDLIHPAGSCQENSVVVESADGQQPKVAEDLLGQTSGTMDTKSVNVIDGLLEFTVQVSSSDKATNGKLTPESFGLQEFYPIPKSG